MLLTVEYFCKWHSQNGMVSKHNTEDCRTKDILATYCTYFNDGQPCPNEGQCPLIHHCSLCKEIEKVHAKIECPKRASKQGNCRTYNRHGECAYGETCVFSHRCEKCGKDHSYSHCPLKPPIVKIECELCDVHQTGTPKQRDEHFTGLKHKHRLTLSKYRCEPCKLDMWAPQKAIDMHLKSNAHKRKVVQLFWRCGVCDLELIGWTTEEELKETHNKTKRHRKALKMAHADGSKRTKCEICNLILSPNEHAEHFKSKEHIDNIAKRKAGGKDICTDCNLDLGNNKVNQDQHYNGKRHHKRVLEAAAARRVGKKQKVSQ